MLRRPRSARQVGQALRGADDGVPWHRVVNAQGSISRRSRLSWMLADSPSGWTSTPSRRNEIAFRPPNADAYWSWYPIGNPSFSISMNNPGVKWLFIALGIVMTLGQAAQNLAKAR